MDYMSLKEGMRFRNDETGATWILTRKFFVEPDYNSGSVWNLPGVEEMQRVEFTPDNGGSPVTYNGWSLHRITEGLIYHPEAEFGLGDYFEIKREGLDPDLRGTLVEVDEKADRWPYKIQGENGNSVWFAWYELTKIHSVVSRDRAPRAVKVLRKRIAETREELEALETALEVLEYARA